MALPDVVEELGGQLKKPAYIVNKRFFAWERPLRPNDVAALDPDAPDGPILGVRTADLHRDDALVRARPN